MRFGAMGARGGFGSLGAGGATMGAAMFADGPAPAGFHWEFVTVGGERVTLNGVYVVALVAD